MEVSMRRSGIAWIVVAVSFAACQEASGPTGPASGDDAAFTRSDKAEEVAGDWVFRFERMVGNDVTGAAGRIRDQNAAGARWRLDRGEARLSQRGELRVKVRGLVLQNTGVSPVAAFRAILSCQTNDGNALINVNLQTATVPVGPEGDAEFRETLSGIPSPCYAPIVFVTSAGGSWFAVSGF
jgi:hypothetical protein